MNDAPMRRYADGPVGLGVQIEFLRPNRGPIVGNNLWYRLIVTIGDCIHKCRVNAMIR